MFTYNKKKEQQMTVKTFKVAGVSVLNGKYKVRYANNKSRAKVLAKNGHTDIELVTLKEALPKEDIIDQLLNHTFKTLEANQAIKEEAKELGFNL
jgi:hypothetical protein